MKTASRCRLFAIAAIAIVCAFLLSISASAGAAGNAYAQTGEISPVVAGGADSMVAFAADGYEDDAEPGISDPFEGYEPRYEAEDGEVVHAAIGDYGDSFSGTGFVGEIDYTDSCVIFTVEAEEDGEYNMLVAYAVGKGFQAATLRIHNEEGYYAQVRCNVIHDWGDFQRDAVAYCKISLKTGENKVTVYKGSNFAQIDFIGIGERVGDYLHKDEVSDAPSVPEGYTRYEAETGYVVNASAKGKAFNQDYGSGYSGGGFVGNLDSSEHYVDIPVTVSEAGAYTVNLRYASGSQVIPTLKVYTGTYGENGHFYNYGTVQCTVRNGWGEFSEEGVAGLIVGLQAGENIVRVKPDYDYAELDCIEVGERSGDYFLGTDESAAENSGDNEFSDDFFSEDKSDGYVLKPLKNTLLWILVGVGAGVLCAAAAVCAVIFIRKAKGRKKEDEKID